MNKQIEEMARAMCGMNKPCILCEVQSPCLMRNCAHLLYAEGYRKSTDVAREIIRDIVDPVWRAYQNSENEMTSLLVAFICECIATKIKKKYESEGEE